MDELEATAEAPQNDAGPAAPKEKTTARKVYPDGPWAIKRIAGVYKEMANDAADRLDMNVGEWLPRAIVRQVEAERASPEGTAAQYDVLAPGPHGGVTILNAGPPLSLAEMRETIELVARLRELTTDKKLTPREAALLRRKVYARVGLPMAPARTPPAPGDGTTKRLTHGQTGL